MERRSILIVAAISIAVSTQSYGAEVRQARIAGIYSNIVDFVETGDVLGTEIFVIPTGGREYVAFYQCWEGESTLPLTLPVEVAGQTISFTVPEDSCGSGTYNGRISKAGFDGTWTIRLLDGSSKNQPVHLKRGKSYWEGNR